jgi:hypothetical protein
MGRYVFIDKGALAMQWQRDFAVDTVMQGRNGGALCIEEKIVRFPENGRPHTRFCLETRSCTVPGREKDGWMCYGRADLLLYCFAAHRDPVMELDCYSIDFSALRKWFWTRLPSANWHTHRTEQINHTESRLVPIAEVQSAGFRCRRHVLHDPFAQFRMDGAA